MLNRTLKQQLKKRTHTQGMVNCSKNHPQQVWTHNRTVNQFCTPPQALYYATVQESTFDDWVHHFLHHHLPKATLKTQWFGRTFSCPFSSTRRYGGKDIATKIMPEGPNWTAFISSIHSLGCEWRYYPVSEIIMVQWKMGVSPIGSLPFKHSLFPLNTDYGRKGGKKMEPLAITHLANSMHSHQTRNASHQTGTYWKANASAFVPCHSGPSSTK